MRPGMSVQVEISYVIAKDTLLAPRAALVFESDVVFAVFPGGHRQSVEIGPCSAHSCAILSGLKEGATLEGRGL